MADRRACHDVRCCELNTFDKLVVAKVYFFEAGGKRAPVKVSMHAV